MNQIVTLQKLPATESMRADQTSSSGVAIDRRRLLGALGSLGTLGSLGMLGALSPLCVRQAFAHSTRALSLSDLLEQSTLRVIATPLETISTWEGDGNSRRIVSYTPLEVHYHLDGTTETGEQPTVRTLGGVVGDIGQIVNSEASLQSGRPCVCFLQPAGDGLLRFSGMAQGHYALDLDELGDARLEPNRAALERAGADPRSAVVRLRGRTLQHCEQLVARELSR